MPSEMLGIEERSRLLNTPTRMEKLTDEMILALEVAIEKDVPWLLARVRELESTTPPGKIIVWNDDSRDLVTTIACWLGTGNAHKALIDFAATLPKGRKLMLEPPGPPLYTIEIRKYEKGD